MSILDRFFGRKKTNEAAMPKEEGETVPQADRVRESKPTYDRRAAMNYAERGAREYDQGKIADAFESFKKTVEADPTFASGWVNLGGFYLYVLRYDEAIKCLETALQLDPDIPGAREYLDQAKGGLAKQLEAKQSAVVAEGDVQVFLEGLRSENEHIRYEAYGRLEKSAESGDKSIVPSLLQVLDNGNDGARSLATTLLGILADKQSTNALITALQDGYWAVRYEAIEALGKIGDPKAIEPIRQCIQREGGADIPSQRVRGRGRMVLRDVFNNIDANPESATPTAAYRTCPACYKLTTDPKVTHCPRCGAMLES